MLYHIIIHSNNTIIKTAIESVNEDIIKNALHINYKKYACHKWGNSEKEAHIHINDDFVDMNYTHNTIINYKKGFIEFTNKLDISILPI